MTVPNLVRPTCPGCGASVDFLPGSSSAVCSSCKSVLHVACDASDAVHRADARPVLNVVVHLNGTATRVQPPTAPIQDLEPATTPEPERPEARRARLADTQESLRGVRREIDDERERLAAPSRGRTLSRDAMIGGVALFLCGWVPLSTESTTTEPSIAVAHAEMLERAKSARLSDGTVAVSINRGGVLLTIPLSDPQIFAPDLGERPGYVAEPAIPPTSYPEDTDLLTPSEGWILSRIAEDSAIQRAGFKAGDVITAFGDKPVPVVVERKTAFVHGLHLLKWAGLVGILMALVIQGVRRARLRSLCASKQRLLQQVDELMGLRT